jgi:hypothetical protein
MMNKLPKCEVCGNPATAWPTLRLCLECAQEDENYVTGDNALEGREGILHPGHPSNYGNR